MRVLIIMPSGTARGGAEEALALLAAHWAFTGFTDLRVVFLEEGDLVERIAALGVSVRVIQAGRVRDVRRFFGAIQTVTEEIRHSGSHCVLGWMSKAHLYGAPAAIWAGVPAVYFQHGLPEDGGIDLVSRWLPAAGCLTCSEFVAVGQRARTRVPVLPVYPGVDLLRFAPVTEATRKEIRAGLGLAVDGALVGMVGRLQYWKGMHVFAEAFANLRASGVEAHGVIVGGRHDLEPGYESFLRRRIEELGLGDQLFLAGKQSNANEWMAAMDVVVHASDREPFGMVIVEAMALGKPVIAAAPGGPEEIITEGIDGLLVPAGDATALAAAILRFLAEPEFAQRCGDRAYESARRFSPEQMARKVGNAVRTLTPRSQRSEQSNPKRNS